MAAQLTPAASTGSLARAALLRRMLAERGVVDESPPPTPLEVVAHGMGGSTILCYVGLVEQWHYAGSIDVLCAYLTSSRASLPSPTR